VEIVFFFSFFTRKSCSCFGNKHAALGDLTFVFGLVHCSVDRRLLNMLNYASHHVTMRLG